MAARWGISLELAGLPLRRRAEVYRAAEAAGFTDGWPGEVSGHDGFTQVAVAAMATERMRVGTGVVSVFTRGPAVLAQHAAALQELSEGRFWLGIGSSSNVIVERWNGIPFRRPLTRVRETVEFLRAALAGERAGSGGFKLDQAPQPPPPIAIAALRGKMLRLAGALGDGAWVNFLPLEAVGKVLGEVAAGAEEAGRDPSTVEIFCRLFCLQGDRERALPLARWMFTSYATVPVYEQYFRWLGYSDEIDAMVAAWRAGDRRKAVELAPERLIEEIFIFGTPAEQRERVRAFQSRGIDTPVLLIVPDRDLDVDGWCELVEQLAPPGD